MKLKQKFFKIILGIILTNLLIVFTSCQTSPNNKSLTIRSAHSNWIEESFQTEVVNIGLEKLGYKVEKPKEIDYPALYISIGNGDLDYSVVYYQPGHKKYFENAGGEEKLEGVGILTPNGIQGYQIDKKTADKYNITNLQQLKDPEIAQVFDSDKDGKANLVGCNPGWGCELTIDHHLKAYGLEDTVEHNRGQYTILLADAITRYQKGEPILYYAYNPHWISAVLKPGKDVVWLEVPFTSLPESMGNLSEKDTSVDGKNLGLPKGDQGIVANKKFLEANSVAKKWFELVKIPVADMNTESLRIKEGEDQPEDIQRHAQEWVKNHQQEYDNWLEVARK
ncbi:MULTISPECIES: glycine betaine/L-proline ABC transporter substrate-binding protein ProX [Okeania]|uniref:Proline/glycine betaine ABC transporter substrate-binding protein ProX n=1 Tax=Okeania hirsuta TaxID=1458930 RepID=A0A3N6PAL1_9CYAN|nr:MULTISPECIES: glycine betaine/L-proline ABC transporter substrate-binding protein ProX [Okeania]NES91083.1 glycine betaine/L-proline ABC transporter substrate-binding protein ProX [Okeania sp. SIO2B9]NET77367.1 glycine betaine/L-proline ABC transporter substrate-binding protein ProX [Okeania sp. SIO1F9]RQH18979.1 proline/glycine betaine ABC transporter substrate-binding protein ProX [Okeania hirsuta]RQH43125.1 proline/glycine betaine ABC transporter substrate-binding protein ProX [Okeania hi